LSGDFGKRKFLAMKLIAFFLLLALSGDSDWNEKKIFI
jgi:hypothetical protein